MEISASEGPGLYGLPEVSFAVTKCDKSVLQEIGLCRERCLVKQPCQIQVWQPQGKALTLM